MATPKKEVKKEVAEVEDKKVNKDGFIPNQIIDEETYRKYMLKQTKGA